MKNYMMSAIVLALITTGSFARAEREEKETCSATGTNGWHNLTQGSTAPMSLDECKKRAQAFFNTPMNDNKGVTNPFTGMVKITYYSVQFKKVKINYDSTDGKFTSVLKRDDATITQTGQSDCPLKSFEDGTCS